MAATVLFIGKRNDAGTAQALAFLQQFAVSDLSVALGNFGDPFPTNVAAADAIFSYLSPWIVPAGMLNRAAIALNFHPGPPEYPGIGCTNFALYDGASTYGVTCHHMAAAVDSGSIVTVRRFPVYDSDSVFSLTSRAYAYLLTLWYELIPLWAAGSPLPKADETWARRPYRRHELNELCRIDSQMTEHEVRRRVRATTFPGKPGPRVVIGQHEFTLDDASSRK
jgi:methionyl-tRNA formyltransferase